MSSQELLCEIWIERAATGSRARSAAACKARTSSCGTVGAAVVHGRDLDVLVLPAAVRLLIFDADVWAAVSQDDGDVFVAIERHRTNEPFLAQMSEVALTRIERPAVVVSEVAR